MTEVKKHREFEIFYSGHSGTIAVRNVKDAVGMHRNDDDEYIDLIEISAVKELEAEIEKLKRENEKVKNSYSVLRKQLSVDFQYQEIEKLNNLLDKAVEALGIYKEKSSYVIDADNNVIEFHGLESYWVGTLADETLAEIKEGMK